MAALVAIAPLALIVLLMAVLRWSAANAGLIGLVAATAGAIGVFGFGTRIYAEQGVAGAFIGTGAEAIFSAADILWIILPALSLYELQQRSGAIDAIRTGLMSLSSDKTLLALIIAWFFAPFMEGAAGFGTAYRSGCASSDQPRLHTRRRGRSAAHWSCHRHFVWRARHSDLRADRRVRHQRQQHRAADGVAACEPRAIAGAFDRVHRGHRTFPGEIRGMGHRRRHLFPAALHGLGHVGWTRAADARRSACRRIGICFCSQADACAAI